MKIIKNILFNKSYIRHEMNRIQSKDDNIGSYRINKISLPSYNDKKYILKNGYSRLSHFVECRQFILTFALEKTVILFIIFSTL